MDLFLEGLTLVCTIPNLLVMIFGIIVGLVFGAIPGLTFITGILIVLPMTFGMDPITGIAMLLGVYCGGMTGGSVSAILLGIPGTPSAAATVLDGTPMARNGKADKALGMALFASVTGGILSLIFLCCTAPIIARFTESFGSPERFALIFLGLSTICRVSGKDFAKGLISGLIGILITTVGLDPVMGVQRFTFNSTELMSGIQLLPVLIGMFALPEIISATIKKAKGHAVKANNKLAMPTLNEMRQNAGVIFKSSIIGTIIGAIPGTGGSVACYLAYDAAKSGSKHPERYGTGILEGIAAPESANNAVSGGVMIPLMTLGIPGDSGAAIIMGAFLIHGLRPGPQLFTQNGSLVYGIFISMLIINLLILVIQYFGIRLFIKVLKIPPAQLNGALLALCLIGAFAQNIKYFDVIVVAASGLLCYCLNRAGFPSTPMLLGVALGGMFETNFRMALILSGGSPAIFFTRPISCVVIILTVFIMAYPAIKKRIKARKEKVTTN